MNLAEEEYSDRRMIEFLKENSARPVDEFIKLIVEDVKSFTKEAEQSDDITTLILKRI